MSLADALSSIDTLNLIALGAVVFIGLPHGAMDGALAAHFGWMESKKKAVSFLLGYIAMAALVVGFWFVAPAISFIIFLAISMFHFGKGDVNNQGKQLSTAESLARGGVVIAGISQFHKTDADTIFQALIGSNTDLVWLFLDAAVAITIVCFVISLAGKSGQRARAIFRRNRRPDPDICDSATSRWILDLLLSDSLYATLCDHESDVSRHNFQTANHENYGSVFRNVLGCRTDCTRSAI